MLGIKPDHAVVLARSNSLVEALNGGPPLKCTRHVLALGSAAAAVQSGQTLTRRQIDAADRLIAYMAWGTSELSQLDDTERLSIRKATINALPRLPEMQGNLYSWLLDAREAIGKVATEVVTPSLRHSAGQALAARAAYKNIDATSAFLAPADTLRARTIHDVKGESREAVLVVADNSRPRSRPQQGELWCQPLLGGTVVDEYLEELRIVFVALTRAQRYCALALPDFTNPVIVAGFEAVGFVQAPAN